MKEQRILSEAEWREEGVKKFGPDTSKWRFVCPTSGHLATPEDWRAVKAPHKSIAFSCVGGWMPESTATLGEKGKGPCNYAGGGLFRLNPVLVKTGAVEHQMFDFADGDAA